MPKKMKTYRVYYRLKGDTKAKPFTLLQEAHNADSARKKAQRGLDLMVKGRTITRIVKVKG